MQIVRREAAAELLQLVHGRARRRLARVHARLARRATALAENVQSRLERLGVYWLEEPLRTDDPEAYLSLRRLSPIRIAAGDQFRADIWEVVATGLNPEATLLVIASWTPQRGLRVVERE